MSAFPGYPNLNKGPEINLPQFADLIDIYRSLLDQTGIARSSDDIARNLEHFSKLDRAEQVEEVCALLSYYSDRGESVFIYTGSGFFEESGNPKPWIEVLFSALSTSDQKPVCLITNRRFRDDFLINHSNVIQVPIPALENGDIRALVTSVTSIYGIEPFSFGEATLRAIGGHPGVAKQAVRLVANSGLDLIERQPHRVFSIQDFILSRNIDDANLSDIQKKILFVLSWIPSLKHHLLNVVVAPEDDAAVQDEYVRAVEELILSCLVVLHGDEYAIANELREIFRRRYGFGDDALLERLGNVLQEAWEEAHRSGRLDVNLIDAFLFMHAIAGRAIPAELKKLLLPSRLAEILRTRYSQGRDDAQALDKVIEWGNASRDMQMDQTVREEILSLLVQANVRRRRYPEADRLIGEMERGGFRSVPFLKGFRLRREGRMDDAIPHLREAIRTGKSLRFSVQELATIYHRQGRSKELNDLLQEFRNEVRDSAVLVDFQVGILISSSAFSDAESLIRELSELPQDDGRSAIRRAQIVSKRDGLHGRALEIVTELVRDGIGEQVRTRRWRALFAILAGDETTALRDIEYLSTRNGLEQTTLRLRTRLALAKGDGKAAWRLSEQLDMRIMQNRVLRAAALEARAQERAVGAHDRSQFTGEAQRLRANTFGEDVDV